MDFKIDAYRDHIEMKKVGGESTLMSKTSAQELIKRTMRNKDSNKTKQLAFDASTNFMKNEDEYASLQYEFTEKRDKTSRLS